MNIIHMSEDSLKNDEIAIELADEDSQIVPATEVGGVPQEIGYGKGFTLAVKPPGADFEGGLYRVDRNAIEIRVAEINPESLHVDIPEWNSRLAKSFPEGTYRIIVKSLGNTLVNQEYELARPGNDRNKIVKARQ